MGSNKHIKTNQVGHIDPSNQFSNLYEL